MDAVLRQLTKAPLTATPPGVLEALRVTAFQLLFLDKVPAYAAVDDGVALAAQGSAGARGFADAVLRRVAAEGAERLATLSEGDDNGAWGVRYSAPRWLVALLREELGDEAAAALLAVSVVAPERACA